MAAGTQMEYTRFLGAKYRKFFRFLDVNKTGYLTERTFKLIGENIHKSKKIDKTAEQDRIQEQIEKWWAPLAALAEDERLDESRFIQVIQFIYSDPDEFERLQINCEAGFSRSFEAIQQSKGHGITRDELHKCYQWFNVFDKRFSERVFDSIDLDADGFLSQKEFSEALHKYFFSNDEHVGCAFLFGVDPVIDDGPVTVRGTGPRGNIPYKKSI